MNEAQMRYALGLNAAPKAKESAFTPGLTVLLSVREKWGGPAQRFAHPTKTLSSLQARIEAEQAARAQGFVVWAVIEIV